MQSIHMFLRTSVFSLIVRFALFLYLGLPASSLPAVAQLGGIELPRETDYTVRWDGNILGRLNCSFEAGMRNGSSVVRSADTVTHFADDATDGRQSLELRDGQRFISEMLPIRPGRYTLSFDAKVLAGMPAVQATVMTSYVKPGSNKVSRPNYGHRRFVGLGEGWQRCSLSFQVPEDGPGYVVIMISPGNSPVDVQGAPPVVHGAEESSVFRLDALNLSKGESSDFVPSAPLEISLRSDGSHAWCGAGQMLPLTVQLFNSEESELQPKLSLEIYDVLHGGKQVPEFSSPVTPLPLGLSSYRFSLELEAGQYLAILRVEVGGEVVTDSLVLSVKATHDDFVANPDSLFLGRIDDDPEAKMIAQDLGWGTSRLHGGEYGIWWDQVEKQEGQFDFSEADHAIGFLEEEYIDMLGLLNYSMRHGPPDWVETVLPGPGAWGRQKPLAKDPQLWRRYVAEMVRHFQGKVIAWEVHNEPNGVMDADSYLEQLKHAYEAAKAVDPDVLILGICSTLDRRDRIEGDMVPFVRTILEKGGADYLDVISFHPYVWPLSPERGGLLRAVRQLQELMADFAPETPLWNTEYGWCEVALRPDRPRTERGANNNYDPGVDYKPMTVANYCVRSHLIQMAAGVDRIQFFNAARPHSVLPYRGAAISLFDYDGTPLPVYLAYRELIQRMESAKFECEFLPQDEVFVQVYQGRSDCSIGVVWKTEECDPSIYDEGVELGRFPGREVKVYDIFGRQVDVFDGDQEVCVPVGESPHYFVVDKLKASSVVDVVGAALGEDSINRKPAL
ncbi:endo-1,4-beta-xylanase [Coraliomargarita parva]|uniref:endo-1,4-beta-xylanase n=1 Tax=Coraliomargarita parva TaxID=3014050 RepID=UPI0022B37113|nr:endo-1,4-beta-xylanase [Coraliomargarita parva]